MLIKDGILEIETNYLKSIIGMASKDGTRSHLQGVRFYNGKMFTTDGHALTLIEVSGLGNELNELMIEAECIKLLPKNEVIKINLTSYSFDLTLLNGGEVRMVLKRYKSIALDSLIPKTSITKSAANSIGFNPELLLKAVKSHPHYNKRVPSLRIEFNDNLAPIKCYLNGELAAVVMPIRL